MKSGVILRKLYRENRKFVTSEVLKEYCGAAGLKYENVMRHFIPRGYLVRIFKGVFYVRSPEEFKLDRIEYDPLKLVAAGLDIKGIKNWYFGLHTALKLNNLTHEYFHVNEVINDTILRTRAMDIAGTKFKFLKLKPALFGFGVTKDDIRYSDPEKTVLDFIYLWNYRGVPEGRVIMDVSEWYPDLSEEKLENYLPNYPKSVRNIIEKMGR
jgi:predicted transcriptional regulator of viral defense system